MFFNKKKKAAYSLEDITPEQQEILNEEKRDMIQGIEELSETAVKEVMIPRIDVDFIAVDTPLDELMTKIRESGHSRFPVYSESIDNVIGVLYVKDLIYSLGKKEIPQLDKIIRKAYFVPESKRIDTLLREFKRRHLHIAIAIDEYGGIAGIITMEDIIEEIVGDIQD
ncbi:CBS domain-containing protein, partial [Treponema porcinum]